MARPLQANISTIRLAKTIHRYVILHTIMSELNSITRLLCVRPAGTRHVAISEAEPFRRPARHVAHPQETETWSTLSCISYAQSSIYVTVPDNAYQVWSRVVQIQPIINAAAVNVRWQPTDFVITTSQTTPTTPSPSSSVSFTTSSPTKGPVASDGPTPPTQGISTGTKIGIGVGVGGGALGFILASTLYFLRARRNKKRKVIEKLGDIPSTNTNNNGASPNLMKPDAPAEMWVVHQAELQTTDNTPEMSTVSNIHEINGSTPAVYPSHNSPWRSAQTYKRWSTHELPAD
ncbi:hypothetical protein EKO27_g8572 [Xylaria grammica]|uniref:Mid2 domain-containing protein n=1 Tax=Xylaria grammica TaxID=363999 RepID=A0A439CWY2_9PEZI|nr:hypothetical protein EKO27_g8572 [Xylaria grammica]